MGKYPDTAYFIVLDALLGRGISLQIKEKFYSGVLGKDTHDFYYILDKSDARTYFRDGDVVGISLVKGTLAKVTLAIGRKYFRIKDGEEL